MLGSHKGKNEIIIIMFKSGFNKSLQKIPASNLKTHFSELWVKNYSNHSV